MCSSIHRYETLSAFISYTLLEELTVIQVDKKNPLIFKPKDMLTFGPGSSVCVMTAYGLDGPGIESRCGRDFPHLSRPALRPNQPPVQRVPGLSRG
jgi:hypothetical protein